MLYQITMSEREYKNLLAFLERTTITGKEVIAYNMVYKDLLNAKTIKPDNKTDKQGGEK
jgi:hypothetical protein